MRIFALLTVFTASSVLGDDADPNTNTWTVTQGGPLRIPLRPLPEGEGGPWTHELTLGPISEASDSYITFIDQDYVTPTFQGKFCDVEKRLCYADLNQTYVITTKDHGDVTITVMKLCGVKPLMTARVTSGSPLGIVVGTLSGEIEATVRIANVDYNHLCSIELSSNTAPIVIGVLLLAIAVGVVAFVIYGRKRRNDGLPMEKEELPKDESPEIEPLESKKTEDC